MIAFSSILPLVAGVFNGLRHGSNVHPNDLIQLSNNQFSEFVPFIEFARAAYCPPTKVEGWQCGDACHALPGFELTLTGGDGDGTQFFFVGFWPAQSAVVVAHQGTNPLHLLSVLTDMDFEFMKPDTALFPNIPSDIRIHSGFALEHRKTAGQILAEVKSLMVEYSSTDVILVGHSLGGALAQLDTLFMKLNLPEGTTVRGVTFGTPRVGNPAWATYFDSQIANFTRINNKRDVVPTVPGRRLGFQHPREEIHIQEDGSVVACPGDDDGTDPQCSDLLVPNIAAGRIPDHLGPYHGISIGTVSCTP
ncbi:Alpha/Beta hydrolase protein [Lactarius quietus]|nr:Alpha/Beta hydrolase protein [Lactarius quietus]